VRKLMRFWFTFTERVTRAGYLAHGLVLMIVKYLTDAALIWAVQGVVWTPMDYLTTGTVLERSKLAGAPAWLPLVLGLWTLPFLWAGVTLTTRRAMDARLSPWFALLFFVPGLNYLAMGVLCLLPSARAPDQAAELPSGMVSKQRAKMEAVGAGLATGVLLALVGVLQLETYGVSLFLGAPFIMGAMAGYVLNARYRADAGETSRVAAWTVIVTGAVLLLFAIEGVVCIAMSLPLALGAAWLGGKLGRFIALSRGSPAYAALAVLLFPLASPVVDGSRPRAAREVRSVVEIDASPEAVWRNVVAFPPIERPSDLLFRTGIAYPTGARIDGQGVGAIRYCDFSTGAFVEPVTVWDPGQRLSFDISRQPAPMRELSPYAIAPPHLDGWFRGVRGEFRLVPLANGGTRLEGTTWYELDIHPAPYFALFADYIVGRIHHRVLTHIESLAEASR
jgi:uncharacterized membrane protein YhaH (DUF805 family)